ncbi:MAG TPA: WhiB family transcriptional regulator [Motilibacteraceae bacterium]|nr:WhiB family transcriptional regulator [Motilibacteraceae bacterium]
MVVPARLPGPLADRWDWQTLAACRRADPTLFFAGDAERGGARRRREEAALAVCTSCPVQVDCLAHALQVREPYGLWGGLSEGELHRRYEITTAAG